MFIKNPECKIDVGIIRRQHLFGTPQNVVLIFIQNMIRKFCIDTLHKYAVNISRIRLFHQSQCLCRRCDIGFFRIGLREILEESDKLIAKCSEFRAHLIQVKVCSV